jgi:hypothetical protein
MMLNAHDIRINLKSAGVTFRCKAKDRRDVKFE